MSHLSTLIASELPSESTAAQQKTYVTFTCLPESETKSESDPNQEPSVLLLERRYLISGSLTTGFRTWEAALHLGSYLLNTDSRKLIEGKNILELGAGTGFLSVLCAKILGANHVTSTDGDEGVVEALKENAFLNNVDDDSKWQASILRWGRALKGTWVEDEFESFPYDTVVGADIVRHPQSRGITLANDDIESDVRQDCDLGSCRDSSVPVRDEAKYSSAHLRCGPELGYI